MALKQITPLVSADDIISHPRFPDARAFYIEECIRVYKFGTFPGNIGADAGRVTALAIIVCLHARYVQDEPETWPTLKRLKETVANFGFASPRLVDAFVARLVQTQFLRMPRHPMDGRIRLLVPTEALASWDREWMAAHFGPLRILFPDTGYTLALDRNPVFQKAHGGASVPVLDGAIHVAWRNIDVVFFLAAKSALSILFILCQLGGEKQDSRLREVDLAAFATEFGVSRSHIRNVLAAAEQRKFVVRYGNKKQFVALTPLWIETFDRFIGDSLSYSDLTYRLALQEMSIR